MVLISPRVHFFEINDQPWFPPYLRAKVQACLTLLWTLQLPIIQFSSPAALVATTLQRVLGPTIKQYIYIDFCAGAGGPTPFIERELNRRLRRGQQKANDASKDTENSNGIDQGVDFVLTDIHPHLEAWTEAAKKSDHLHYVARSVDAGNAPRDLLASRGEGKVFRMFNLAFHHFDDELADKILRNSMDTAEGFGIFELQARTVSSLLMVLLIGPLMMVITPFYFWRSPGHLFFTYVVPVIPFVLVADGIVSSLRTRSAEEVMAMVGKGRGVEGWRFESGSECHTWPIGEMSWIVGLRQDT